MKKKLFSNISKSLLKSHRGRKSEPAGMHGLRKQITKAKEESLELWRESACTRAKVHTLREDGERCWHVLYSKGHLGERGGGERQGHIREREIGRESWPGNFLFSS